MDKEKAGNSKQKLSLHYQVYTQVMHHPTSNKHTDVPFEWNNC